MEARQNYMTVPASIRELKKIEMVCRSKGQYRLDHAVSKKQKTILSAFGMDAFKRSSKSMRGLMIFLEG